MKLALGTVQFGIDYGINNKRGKIPRKEVFKILETAIQNKINFLDTAYAYGNSERLIGEFIEKSKTKFNIISKLPYEGIDDIEKIFEKSLKNLKCNEIYSYLIHDFESFIKKPEKWSILEQLKKRGKVQKIGFSLYHPKELKYILDKKILFDIIQIPFSIFDQRFSKMFNLIKDKNIEVHVRSIFLQGLIFKNPSELEKGFLKIKSKLLKLQSISKESGIPVSALCVNFVTLNENIDKVIIGVDNLMNLQKNIKALEYKNKVKKVYKDLLELKEDDEKIILPTNWNKSI